jgi:hypothetical protein
MTGDMADFFREFYWVYEREVYKEVTLTPLADVYFSGLKGLLLRHGDKQFVLILLALGLAILLFALANYVNLTVAQAGFRTREMAARRLLGATRRKVFVRMMSSLRSRASSRSSWRRGWPPTSPRGRTHCWRRATPTSPPTSRGRCRSGC